MGTYDHKKVLSDYANDRLTVEMAVGHSLQHINKLYDLQSNATVNRLELRARVDTLEQTVTRLQADVARLTTQVEKPPNKPKRKRPSSGSIRQDQP